MDREQKQCNHLEAHVSGLVDDEGNVYTRQVDGHDCEYVEARNALIPFAEAKANKLVGRKAQLVERLSSHAEDEAHAAYVAAWNREFFAEMDRLWAARCATVVRTREQVAA